MRELLLAVLLILHTSAFAGIRPALPLEQCAKHAPYGHITSWKSDTTIVCREGYLLEHDNKARIPIWVSYLLTPESAVGCAERDTAFKQDPALPKDASGTAKDYAKSGYDIGLFANSADMRLSPELEEDSNSFSNAAPTNPTLNRGAWKTLEDVTRGWALERGPILVYIGSVYDRKLSKKLNGRVSIPEAFVKILIDQKTQEALVFLYPNTSQTANPKMFRTSFAEAQKQTKLRFPMPPNVKHSDELWPITLKSARAAKTTACSLK